jgi:quinate dehydrogenase
MRDKEFIGGAVTMPMKLSIMSKLDELDDQAKTMGACNTITALPGGKLVGSNTDSAGIRDALAEVSFRGHGKPGMVIGAGGASRAAIYALLVHLGCSVVYLVNREPQKAKQLVIDITNSGLAQCQESVIVVESVDQARALQAPFYSVGCVPNNTPFTEGEKNARAIVDNLFRSDYKGVFLDMCFKPRVTQLVEIAEVPGRT